MKKSISLILALSLLLCIFSGCEKKAAAPQGDAANAETVSFTDSAGRTVTLPATVTRVAPSGSVASMFLTAVAPEYMVCLSNEIYDSQKKYLDSRIPQLPLTGQFFGGKSNMNLEALLSAAPEIIIDMGDYSEGIEDDLDAVQAQTGIPVIFIESSLPNMADAFRTLGSVLSGKEARCGELAAYVDETLLLAKTNSALIPESERISVMFTAGASGLNTNAKGSSQAQVIELIGAENAVVVDSVTSKNGGNTINMEQLYLFDPDAIIFLSGSIYGTVAADESWAKLRAVKSGKYYEIPSLPYNWMSSPPSMNMLIGIRWLGNLLYPAVYDFDMVEEAQRAFRLFWNYELTDAEAREMLSTSTLKAK